MSTEVLVWRINENMTHRLVESVTISWELVCSTCLFFLCLTICHSDAKSVAVGPHLHHLRKIVPPVPDKNIF